MKNGLTVIIPARNEQYLQKTIENVLENAEGEVEIIAICDGYWPDPPIKDEARVRILHNTVARGQRHSINDAAKFARGKYIMKLDAHCSVDKGFDVILARDCEYDMTMIPRMYNLDVVTWQPKKHKMTDYMYISSLTDEKPFRATYYGSRQPKNNKMIDDIMCCMGPCFFMHKDRFWELDGCDESHGHWGQQGIELSCKAWLSGGRLVVNKNTWFAHWFRGGGVPKGHKSGFPYPMKQKQVDKARKYSQDLWLNNKWYKQKRNFDFLIEKFNPPGWEDMTIIYYTDNTCPEPLFSKVKENLRKLNYPVIEVHNETKERSHLELFKNIARGLEQVKTKYVATAEHDCFYPKEHYDFRPKEDDVFYYNTNHWFLTTDNQTYYQPVKTRRALSGLICNKELLEKAVKERIKFLENGGVLKRKIPGACEFGIVDDYKSQDFSTKEPYLDVRHGNNFSGYRKGKNKTKYLAPWGTYKQLIGEEVKWYQEATINGVKMPTQRKKDTNEKRWKTFIEPLIHGGGVFTDLGCNAGFYCRKAVDLGFKANGVELNEDYFGHAKYWEQEEPKGVRITQGDMVDYDFPASNYVLMANVHYWLTPERLKILVKKLSERALNVVVVGRHNNHKTHYSASDFDSLQKTFKCFKIKKRVNGSKHYSVLFENPNLVELKTNEVFKNQQLAGSRRFYPSYKKLIETGDSKEYSEYLKWRKFPDKYLKKHTQLIESIKEKGIINPLKMQEDKVIDGDHRLIIANELGFDKIICLKN